MRSKAKMINYGIVYGLSDYGLADRLNIPREEAKAFIDAYLERFPTVAEFMERTIGSATAEGYVTTLWGRRRNIPELRARNWTTRSLGERLAVNTVIQGTAADIIKLAMVRCHNALAEHGLADAADPPDPRRAPLRGAARRRGARPGDPRARDGGGMGARAGAGGGQRRGRELAGGEVGLESAEGEAGLDRAAPQGMLTPRWPRSESTSGLLVVEDATGDRASGAPRSAARSCGAIEDRRTRRIYNLRAAIWAVLGAGVVLYLFLLAVGRDQPRQRARDHRGGGGGGRRLGLPRLAAAVVGRLLLAGRPGTAGLLSEIRAISRRRATPPASGDGTR